MRVRFSAVLVVCLLGVSTRAWAGDASEAYGGTYTGTFCVCYKDGEIGGTGYHWEDYGLMTWQVSDQGVTSNWVLEGDSCITLAGSGTITPLGTWDMADGWYNGDHIMYTGFPIAGTACLAPGGVGLQGNSWFPHLNVQEGLWGTYLLDTPGTADSPASYCPAPDNNGNVPPPDPNDPNDVRNSYRDRCDDICAQPVDLCP